MSPIRSTSDVDETLRLVSGGAGRREENKACHDAANGTSSRMSRRGVQMTLDVILRCVGPPLMKHPTSGNSRIAAMIRGPRFPSPKLRARRQHGDVSRRFQARVVSAQQSPVSLGYLHAAQLGLARACCQTGLLRGVPGGKLKALRYLVAARRAALASRPLSHPSGCSPYTLSFHSPR